MLKLASCVVAVGTALVLAACAPQGVNEAESTGGDAPTSNDTVVLGDLDRYSPDVEQAAAEGASLGFDEESNLQQEKTAGFSGGAVVSNIEPLGPGIDDYAEEEPVGMYATTGEPTVVPHGSANGTECLSCHASGAQAVPSSHVANGIENDQCASCHVID